MKRPHAVLIFIAALIFAGCHRGRAGEQEAVRGVLLQRQQALNLKDVERYASLISSRYRAGDQDYAAKTQELTANFAGYDKINYRADGFIIGINGNRATASCRYVLKISKGNKEVNLEGEENLLLEKESGRWKFIGGL